MIFELSQYSDMSFFILRLVVGVIFFYHALPKLKNSSMMAQKIGWSGWTIFLLGAVEFLSSLGMMFGVYVQIAALFLCVVMLGAIYHKTMKWNVGFSPWDKTGWEFDLTLLAANLFLLVNGGGGIGIN